ncbi:MAG: ATPase [Methyloceanibacter sp.]|nr:MAG: ATPase [Methyloceanibacter sp.]
MDDLLSEFLIETGEQLDELDASLVRFEREPNDAGMLNTIFRVAHTIKGTCGFFDLPRLAKLAHAAEALMGRYRDGAAVSTEGVTAILASLDRFKEILGDLARDGIEPQGSDDDLVQELRALADACVVPAHAGEPDRGDAENDEGAAETALRASPVRERFDALERAWQETQRPAKAPADIADTAPAFEDAAPDAAEPAPMAAGENPDASAVRHQTVRVAVATLDTLMTTVSELVLTRNQLRDLASRTGAEAFAPPLQRLSAVTVELQEAIMKARMQPIANAWQKLPVLVRTLSVELGKPIEIEMRGGDEELDRQVLEAIKDPLTHMVRNAADHGLESPSERIAAGKPKTGRITLRASQQGGTIVVEVSDDGRGLDVGALRATALAKGLAAPDELDALGANEICQFIFEPGFSTAGAVSHISGRGVGMDVVRSNIESIGGSVDLASSSSQGTTFVIKIPLTLAIMSALIVEVAGVSFAVPQFGVVELVRAGDASGHRVEIMNGAAVLRLRNKLLPLLDLGSRLRLRDQDWSEANTAGKTAVIVQAGAQRFGVLVDRVSHNEEIVVKPLASVLRQIPVFSANTILGDGRVIMIVDHGALAEAAGPADLLGEDTLADAPATEEENRMALLLFRAGTPVLKAVPLSLVTRLEEIPAAAIETCDGQDVTQYRGSLLPLVHLKDRHPEPSKAMLPVLVFTEGGRAAGFVVDEIVDIVEDHLAIDLRADGAGVAGSGIVRGEAVEIVDVSHYLGPLFEQQGARRVRGAVRQPRILLVDDGQFFREMLAPLLRGSGYAVTALASAREALALKENGERFDAVVTDVDMPGLNGFDLARLIRADAGWNAVLLIALSSHPSSRLVETGRLAGFDAFVGKFDRRSLMDVLRSCCEGWGEAA